MTSALPTPTLSGEMRSSVMNSPPGRPHNSSVAGSGSSLNVVRLSSVNAISASERQTAQHTICLASCPTCIECLPQAIRRRVARLETRSMVQFIT
jgi:hypothetical protein